MYLKTKGIEKTLGLEDNLISENSKYVNDTTNPVNSVYDLFLYKKWLFVTNKQEENSCLFFNLLLISATHKIYNTVSSNEPQ